MRQEPAKIFGTLFKELEGNSFKTNSDAQFMLGQMLYSGSGIPMDRDKGLGLLFKSADEGNLVAQNVLGIIYENGDGVAANLRLAKDSYLKSAEQGSVSALYNLGSLHYYDIKNQEEQGLIFLKKRHKI